MPRSQRDLLVERTRLGCARAEYVDEARLENIYQRVRVRNPVCSKLLEWCRAVPAFCVSGGQANASCADAEVCYPQRHARELARSRAQAALLVAQEDTAAAGRCPHTPCLREPGSQAVPRRDYAFKRLDSGKRKHEKGVHWAYSVDAEAGSAAADAASDASTSAWDARSTRTMHSLYTPLNNARPAHDAEAGAAAADAASEASTSSWDARSTRTMHSLYTPLNNARPAHACLRDYQTAYNQRRAAGKAHRGQGGHSGSTTYPSTSCFDDDDAFCQASTAGAACDEAPLLPEKRVHWSGTVQVFSI
jgi:hypothetical protein